MVLKAIPLYENLLLTLKYLDPNVNKLSVICSKKSGHICSCYTKQIFGNIYDRKQMNALFWRFLLSYDPGDCMIFVKQFRDYPIKKFFDVGLCVQVEHKWVIFLNRNRYTSLYDLHPNTKPFQLLRVKCGGRCQCLMCWQNCQK